MDRNGEYIKNTILLLLGKFSTQFTSLLLLPIYTRYLLVDEFGMVDLIQTYLMLFVPVLTLRVDSGLFRYLIEARKNDEMKKKIISNSLLMLLIQILLSGILVHVFNIVNPLNFYIQTVMALISMMISTIFLQVLRGIGKTREYSIASMITGGVTFVLSVVFIVIMGSGAEVILLSAAIANILSSIYIMYVVDLKKWIAFNSLNRSTCKMILDYSLPMIPNALSWWIVSVSDRTVISVFAGLGANAIYTVSCKFSNILNNFFSIFNMSWQESAALHIDDDDRDDFFTEMINNILMFFMTTSMLIIAVMPLVFDLVVGPQYYESYQYIPILIYGNVWNVLTGLIGSIYLALKKTKEVAITTMCAASINLFVNLILVKFIGIYAACISTLVSYVAMSIYRLWDSKKYINIKIYWIKLSICTLIYFVTAVIYISDRSVLQLVNFVVVLIFVMIINKEILIIINKKLLLACKSNVIKHQ